MRSLIRLCSKVLPEKSLLVFDCGGNTLENKRRIRNLKFHYLTIRSSHITNLCHFPNDQRTLGLCFFIAWIQLDCFIECTKCIDIFSKIYQCQTLVEPRICEFRVNIRCLPECVHRITVFIFTGHLDFLRASLKFR